MEKFETSAFEVFGKEWALLTAGSIDDYNTMTIIWGGMGTLWAKPVVTVYVKPIRYTYEFMERSDYFTVSFYDEKFRPDLTVLGTESGRDGDKVAKTSLVPVKADDGVTFKQAKRTLLCKKLYTQKLDLEKFPEGVAEKFYVNEPAHVMYIGEVIKIL